MEIDRSYATNLTIFDSVGKSTKYVASNSRYRYSIASRVPYIDESYQLEYFHLIQNPTCMAYIGTTVLSGSIDITIYYTTLDSPNTYAINTASLPVTGSAGTNLRYIKIPMDYPFIILYYIKFKAINVSINGYEGLSSDYCIYVSRLYDMSD